MVGIDVSARTSQNCLAFCWLVHDFFRAKGEGPECGCDMEEVWWTHNNKEVVTLYGAQAIR